MTAIAFVVLAGCGALGRWQLSRLNTRGWPGGTLAANTGACLMLGLLADTSSNTLTLAGVGLLGSYSTFSTVTREVTDLTDNEGLARAVRYLSLTLLLGIGAALIGIELGAG